LKLNCAALPESLLETELFGHEAGAFTGAVRRRIGRFEQADGGSLILDEIANAPLSVQEKILRVVEYGEFERVGASATQTCDVRLIAATNVDLPTEADAGRFRHDLLDRLAFDVLTVPPLKARTGDVAILADHFARAMAVELDWEAFPGISETAMTALQDYDWPGNVRELKNVVERAVYRWSDSSHALEDIQFDPFESPYRPATRKGDSRETAFHVDAVSAETVEPSEPISMPPNLDAAVDGYEARLLREALKACRYNQRDTARRLGLTYHQLRGRLKKHGLLQSYPQTVDDARN
ncbi:MAG: sigma 54-interacting transcriptional regulator, partial [Rhodospirillales bacterium]|nr:sigma 54-interacting transcriptional regulator [Rhodospirillales bacterium]